jgi:hypothetical protein
VSLSLFTWGRKQNQFPKRCFKLFRIPHNEQSAETQWFQVYLHSWWLLDYKHYRLHRWKSLKFSIDMQIDSRSSWKVFANLNPGMISSNPTRDTGEHLRFIYVSPCAAKKTRRWGDSPPRVLPDIYKQYPENRKLWRPRLHWHAVTWRKERLSSLSRNQRKDKENSIWVWITFEMHFINLDWLSLLFYAF